MLCAGGGRRLSGGASRSPVSSHGDNPVAAAIKELPQSARAQLSYLECQWRADPTNLSPSTSNSNDLPTAARVLACRWPNI